MPVTEKPPTRIRESAEEGDAHDLRVCDSVAWHFCWRDEYVRLWHRASKTFNDLYASGTTKSWRPGMSTAAKDIAVVN